MNHSTFIHINDGIANVDLSLRACTEWVKCTKWVPNE
jgi:hypothetical protein